MTASLLLAAAILLPAQEPERPYGPPPDTFKPDPAWKALRPKPLVRPQRPPPGPPRPGLPPRGPSNTCSASRGPRSTRRSSPPPPPAPDPRRPAPDRGRARPPGPVPPQVRAPGRLPDRHRRRMGRGRQDEDASTPSRVLDSKTNKPLDRDWVFAGSELFDDPDDQEDDLRRRRRRPDHRRQLRRLDPRPPFASTANDADRSFVANTDKIPPRNTYVSIILKPIKEPDAAKR